MTYLTSYIVYKESQKLWISLLGIALGFTFDGLGTDFRVITLHALRAWIFQGPIQGDDFLILVANIMSLTTIDEESTELKVIQDHLNTVAEKIERITNAIPVVYPIFQNLREKLDNRESNPRAMFRKVKLLGRIFEAREISPTTVSICAVPLMKYLEDIIFSLRRLVIIINTDENFYDPYQEQTPILDHIRDTIFRFDQMARIPIFQEFLKPFSFYKIKRKASSVFTMGRTMYSVVEFLREWIEKMHNCTIELHFKVADAIRKADNLEPKDKSFLIRPIPDLISIISHRCGIDFDPSLMSKNCILNRYLVNSVFRDDAWFYGGRFSNNHLQSNKVIGGILVVRFLRYQPFLAAKDWSLLNNILQRLINPGCLTIAESLQVLMYFFKAANHLWNQPTRSTKQKDCS